MTSLNIPYRTVIDTDDLARSCERWRLAGAVAVDTEFARERTFYAGLGLIQISDGKDHTLVDPLEVEDLTPLTDLLTDPNIVKVFHSCGEDLEVFHHHLGAVPTPMVDTQIAAALSGLGWSMGYARLVEAICGVELPKGQTRSNWMRRPLSDAQQRYAALDVAYLLPCYQKLMDALTDQGRLPWLKEECDRLTAPDRFRVDDEKAFRKFARGRRLRKHQLVVLRELFMWRESSARERDLPRGFVIKDPAMQAIALRRPENFEDLRRIRELDQGALRRHGKTLLRLVAEARARPVHEQPEPTPPPLDLRPYKELLKAMKGFIADIAAEHELPVEVLGNKRSQEALVRRVLESEEPALPKALRGWREPVIGEPLERFVRRRLG